MKKKILSILLTVCILMSAFTTGMIAFADDETPTYNVEVVAAGKDITVTITLPGGVGVAGGDINLVYDNTKMTCLDTEDTVDCAAIAVVNPAYSENTVRVNFASARAIREDTVLATIDFAYVSGTVSADDFSVTTFNMFGVEQGEVISNNTMASITPGFDCDHAQTTEQRVEPTHVEDGSVSEVCTVCGEVISSTVLPATGHTFGEWEETKAPTCTEPGEETRTCSCGATESRPVDALGHSYGEWIVDKEATCTEAGSRHRECSACGNVETEEMAALGHDEGKWVTVKEASCIEEGLKELRCTRDGYALDSEIIKKTAHTFGDVITDTPATCTEMGVGHQVCSVCGYQEEVFLPMTPHVEGETITDEPTCTDWGVATTYCAVCGEVMIIADIPPVGHTYGEWIVDKEATCTEAGSQHRVCSVCGEVETEEIAALGHSYGEWIVDTEATVDAAGSQHRVCSVCGAVETQEIPQLTPADPDDDKPVTGTEKPAADDTTAPAAQGGNNVDNPAIPDTGLTEQATLAGGAVILAASLIAVAVVLILKKRSALNK